MEISRPWDDPNSNPLEDLRTAYHNNLENRKHWKSSHHAYMGFQNYQPDPMQEMLERVLMNLRNRRIIK